MDNLIGKRIAQYHIEAILGEGGMGVVYRATDTNLARPVALKVMHRHLARQPEFQQRFMQEAQAAARLNHPSIVTVYNFDSRDDLLYIVMEYVPGQGLGTYLEQLKGRQQIIELDETLFLIAQAADALGFAHERGVIHRDVKPDNILLMRLRQPERPGEPSFRVKVTDFGLAKLLEEGGVHTATGTFLGTLPYMSPEQALGRPLDGRSDIYSLGVMLYQLATGRLPFEINSPTEAVIKHMQETPPPPVQVRPGLPRGVAVIISRAIAKRPEDRFQTAGEMALALRRTLAGLTVAETDLFETPDATVSLATQVRAYTEGALPPTAQLDTAAAVAGAGHDQLTAGREGEPALTFFLDKPALTVGRAATNDIVLVGEGVSRQHLRLEKRGGDWLITDLGSTNGTLLNGRPLPANQPQTWPPGQPLQVGEYWLNWRPADTVRAAAYAPALAPTAAAAGESEARSPSGQMEILVQPAALELNPGEQANLRVEVTNRSSVSAQFALRAEGLPPDWITLTREPIRLLPGGRGLLPATLHPPRHSAATGGQHPFRLVVRSLANPQEQAAVTVDLRLRPFLDYSVGLQPDHLEGGGVARVSIRNTGNVVAPFTVTGRDPRHALQFDPPQATVRVPPGKTGTVDLQITPRQRPLVGGSRSLPYEIEVGSAGQPPEIIPGRVSLQPTLPGWAMTLLGLGLLLCCLGAGLLYAFSNQQDRQAAQQTATAQQLTAIAGQPSVTPTDAQAAAETATAGQATALAATEIALTAEAELTPSVTATATETATPTETPTGEPTPTETPSPPPPSETPTATPTDTPEPPTETPTVTVAPTPIGGGGGLLAFATNRTGNFEIFIMNLDGSGPENLTSDGDTDWTPAWSPDGTQIAFLSNRDGNNEIYLMNATGSGQTNLTENPALDFEPAWSPDGDRIAFASDRDGNIEIYVMNSDGSDVTRLTDDPGNDFSPIWSPDGNRIAFVSSRDGNSEIYVMNADGSDQIRLTNNSDDDFDPDWSPDGSRIVFVSRRDGNEEIYVMAASGTAQTRLTNNPAADRNPRWSPDSIWIAFQSNRDGDEEVFIMRADGAAVTQVTNNNDDDQHPAWQPAP